MKLRGCGPSAVASQGLLQTLLPQNLLTLRRKLEEREEALLGQTQVVELLQQELRGAEQQNQVPFSVLTALLCVDGRSFVLTELVEVPT